MWCHHQGGTHLCRVASVWAFESLSLFFSPFKRKIWNCFCTWTISKVKEPRQRASDLLWFDRAAFVWVSPSMTRADDLMACRRRGGCCRNTLGDDSVGEQVRSQPIVTNGSEISRGTSNCVGNSNLIIYKAAPRTLSGSNGGLPSARAAAEQRLYSREKRRWVGGNEVYSSCQNFLLSEFLLLQVPH